MRHRRRLTPVSPHHAPAHVPYRESTADRRAARAVANSPVRLLLIRYGAATPADAAVSCADCRQGRLTAGASPLATSVSALAHFRVPGRRPARFASGSTTYLYSDYVRYSSRRAGWRSAALHRLWPEYGGLRCRGIRLRLPESGSEYRLSDRYVAGRPRRGRALPDSARAKRHSPAVSDRSSVQKRRYSGPVANRSLLVRTVSLFLW